MQTRSSRFGIPIEVVITPPTVIEHYCRNGITQSMSRKGNSSDNAVSESIFRTLKTEPALHQDYQTRAKPKQDIFDYIEVFYNRERLKDYLSQ